MDTYVSGSVKESERIRRCQGTPIEVNLLNKDTPLPVDLDAFWASSSNKVKLLELLRSQILDKATVTFPNVYIIVSASGVSGKNNMFPCQLISNKLLTTIADLNLNIEEDDLC